MNRKDFLLHAMGISGAFLLDPTSTVFANNSDNLFQKLIKGNDNFVKDFLSKGLEATKQGGRAYGYNFAKLSAAYCQPQSKFYKNKTIVTFLENIAVNFSNVLRKDGTMNAGNIESPPDTAFVMEPLCSGVYILTSLKDSALEKVLSLIKVPIERVGHALSIGGVHTPNHRWEICSALARIHKLYPSSKYVARIEEWLSEGVFIDEDGHYPERSMNYSDVENRAFITIAHILDKPELLKPVAKNLEMAWYYTEANGELITFDSRRQDQFGSKEIMVQYLHYRYMSIKTHNKLFSAIAKFIETLPEFEVSVINQNLYNFMADDILQKTLPSPEKLPKDYEKLFPTSSLARIRRNDTSLTLFGGNDLPLIIASGRSISPNFFGYRKGLAALKYARLSSNFFSMGYFRSEGLKKENGKYVLSQTLEAQYYQPLPNALKRKDGDYDLTPSIDDRFWSKMSFDKRTYDAKRLESKIEVKEAQGNVELNFEVDGPEGVEVTIQLCFDEIGEIQGADSVNENTYFLEKGMGRFKVGNDSIEFGPGLKQHSWIKGLEGEKYSVLNGHLNTPAKHVYITGLTPFKHTLKFS